MTNQLVSFASVEQQIGMNTNLAKLIGLQQAAQLTAAAPLMGKTVEVESDRLCAAGRHGTLRLPAAGAASLARVTVLDAGGRTLKQAERDRSAPAATGLAMGRPQRAGQRQPDGGLPHRHRRARRGRRAAGGRRPPCWPAPPRRSAPGGGDLKLVLGGLSVGFDAVRGLGQ